MPTKVTDPAILAALNGGGQPAPTQQSPSAYPGVIPGRPKPPAEPTPVNPRTIYEDERDYGDKTKNDLFSNEQGLRKEFYSLPAVKEFQVASRTYANSLQAADDASGDQSLIVAYAKMLDPGSVVREGEAAAVAGADSTVGRSIAKLQKEFGFENGGQLSPDIRAKIRREMKTLAENYGKAYELERGQFEGLASSYGFDPNRVVGQHLLDPYRETIDGYWQKAEAAEAPPEEEDGALAGGVSYEGETWEQRQARELAEQRGQRGEGDAARLMRQGVTLGLSDEVAGIGTAIGRGLTGDFNLAQNYRIGRDADRINNAAARENMGWGGTAIEAVSGMGSVANVAGKAGNMLVQGMGLGGLGGFGYGEGLAGSAINAAGGAALGGSIGLAGQKFANALTNRTQATTFDPARARQVAQAGEAENVTVNRAMIDPRQENTFSGVEATRVGGPRVNRQMNEIEGQIEGRVQQLGGNRQPLDRTATGDRVQRAGERFIRESREVTNKKYTAAERMAGDARVDPVRARSSTDEMIGKLGGTKDTGLFDASGKPITRIEEGSGLSETANVNSAELTYLKGLREDFSKPLTISALRSMRTKLRKKISNGDLVFGEDEARVLSIMDEAAQDIGNGLAQQGRANAAAAFGAADTAYAARMEFINSTVQKLIGKRNANLSAEQVASKFESMARNDAEGLRKFWTALDPDERVDMQATFAEALGRNGKGEFSPAIFLNNVSGNSRKMSERAIRTVFGREGAESIKNLKVLAEEVNRLNALRNRSNTGRVNNYRSWLVDALVGGGTAGGAGLMTGGVGAGTAAAIGGAATATAVKAGRDLLNARMLMNPKITKWISQAPSSSEPAAINAHFGRLQAIAKAEPALAGEIEVLRKAILGAANDNARPLSLAAEDQNAEEND